MKIKYILWVLCLCLSTQVWADSMRCQGKLISRGDLESKVLKLCGKPTASYEWTEAETQYQPSYPGPWYDPYAKKPNQLVFPPLEQPVYVTIQYSRWTYDLGSTQFIKYLVFKNGIVDQIVEGDYGGQ